MTVNYYKKESGVIQMIPKPRLVPKEQTLLDFTTLFVNKNNIRLDELSFLTMMTDYYVTYEGKRFEGKRLNKMVVIENDKYLIEFIPVDINMIEIYKIEVFDKRKGTGTHLMNKILDISDELGKSVKVIPIVFKEDSMTQYKLRDWYRSFGFDSKGILKRPELFYIPDLETSQVQVA
ncbi:MAG: hypothetical protein O2U61_01095 [Candidatus Bathyarchaeota archaeon]|nr:hypothetical protein [Candidatus Bathyarchaeota archaeon]